MGYNKEKKTHGVQTSSQRPAVSIWGVLSAKEVEDMPGEIKMWSTRWKPTPCCPGEFSHLFQKMSSARFRYLEQLC